MDLFLFDFDKTLYAYDSSKRLPAQSRLSGVSQYHLAKTWWAAGYEVRAEKGEWATPEAYLEEFAAVTGARLTLDQWCEARHAASTPNLGVVAALKRASELGTVSLFSNNPPPFSATLDEMAPDVSAILGANVLVSYQLGVRKPAKEAFELAVAHYNGTPETTFFVDDSAANVAGARSIGITAFHYTGLGDGGDAALTAAIEAFAARTA